MRPQSRHWEKKNTDTKLTSPKKLTKLTSPKRGDLVLKRYIPFYAASHLAFLFTTDPSFYTIETFISM